VYTLGRGELHISREVTPLERYHHNNRSFAHLEAACAMAQALRQSQLLEKPAPMLYELFLVFLQGLETCELPRTWTCSFLLKILRRSPRTLDPEELA
jgi:recombinational DNA repair protein (RecF pathway)